MGIVTINGQRGSGAPEIGTQVAERLLYTYVDRQVLGEAAKRLGTTEEVLEEKKETSLSGSRIARILGRFMDRMGTASIGGDLFAPFTIGQDYGDLMAEMHIGEQRLDDKRFREAMVAVVRDLAEDGDVVIVGRASNIILKDHPQALHIGLVSTLESRIAVVAQREGLSLEDAKTFTERAEQARLEFFLGYFNVSADYPANFHLMLNTHLLNRTRAVDIIIGSVQSLQ